MPVKPSLDCLSARDLLEESRTRQSEKRGFRGGLTDGQTVAMNHHNRESEMKAGSLIVLLASGGWVATAGTSAAAERPGGVRVDVDRGDVHVEVGTPRDQANAPVVKASDVLGVRVYNPSKEELGEIEDLVINPASGRVRYAVLSFGGLLGVGDKLFAVPWADLKRVTKGTTDAGTLKEDYYVLNASKDALKNAPGFHKDKWPDFGSRNWSADVDKFYTGQRAPAATTKRVDRTNTGVNLRDRDSTAKTPLDQNENKADITITAAIRKRVVATKMSINAQNVKIITQDGRVTLRGPVKTEQEKRTIEEIARDVAGANKVDSQLEVNNE